MPRKMRLRRQTLTSRSEIAIHLSSFHLRRMKHIRIRWRLEIMCAKRRHGKLARLVAFKERGLAFTGQSLIVDFPLQFHESMQKRFWPWRASGNVNIDWNVAVDPFQNVVTLLERPAGDCARPHRDHVFGVGHLVVESHYLWRHFFGD